MKTVYVGKSKTQILVSTHDDQRELEKLCKKIPGYAWSKRIMGWTFPLDVDVYVELFAELAVDGTWSVTQLPEARDWATAAMTRVGAAIAARSATQYGLTIPWQGQLYEFQKRGVAFCLAAKRALLTDEMGLGKTVEAIATIEELKLRTLGQDAHVLVVCTKGMMYTWRDEIQRWGACDSTILTHCRELEAKKTAPGYYIINWQKLPVREGPLTKVPWDAIIVDESHRAKNRKAKQTLSLGRIHATYKLMLTGTPVRNDVMDLWSQLHWLDPYRFPSYWKFFDQYADWELEWLGNKEVKKIKGVANEEKLDRTLKSIMFGRKLDDVEIELPPVVGPKRIIVDLEGEQRKAYDQMRDEFVTWLEDAPDDVIIARNWIAQIIRLKQLAGSLGIFWDKHDSAKFDAYEELVNSIPAHEKFCVYSQFTTVTDELEKRLRMRGEAYALFTGPKNYVWGPNRGEVKMDRGEIQSVFQNRPEVKHFVGTIAAGGEGLTLTAARRLVLLDLPWTPAEIEQVQRRVYRIGQTQTTFLYHILARDTVDFITILPTIRRKEQIIDIIMAGSSK